MHSRLEITLNMFLKKTEYFHQISVLAGFHCSNVRANVLLGGRVRNSITLEGRWIFTDLSLFGGRAVDSYRKCAEKFANFVTYCLFEILMILRAPEKGVYSRDLKVCNYTM